MPERSVPDESAHAQTSGEVLGIRRGADYEATIVAAEWHKEESRPTWSKDAYAAWGTIAAVLVVLASLAIGADKGSDPLRAYSQNLSQRTSPLPKPKDARSIDQRRVKHVLIGNSMLHSRIDEKLFSKIVKQPVLVTWAGGIGSAGWYLMLKNRVLRARRVPETITIFFREDVLVRPSYRTTGKYERTLRSYMMGDEAEFFRVLDQVTWSPRERFQRWTKSSLGLETLRERSEERLYSLANSIAGALTSNRTLKEQREQVTVALSGELRAGLEDQEHIDYEAERGRVVPIEQSFLPLMVDLTRERGIALNLVRVQRSSANRERDRQYFRDVVEPHLVELRDYARSEGIRLVELDDAPWIRPEWYEKRGDHILGKYRRAYTRAFLKHQGDLYRTDRVGTGEGSPPEGKQE